MKMKILGIALLLSLTSSAYAFKILSGPDTGSRWATFPIVFQMTTSEFSQTILDVSEYVAFAKAMQTWSHVPGSKLKMTLNPTPFSGTCAQAIASGVNVICFFPTRASIATILSGGTTTITAATVATGGFFSDTAGVISGGFVLVNEEDHTFRTDTFSGADIGRFDMQAVALHELGHVAGLDHTNKDPAVMFSNSDPNASKSRRVPHEDDLRGIQYLYQNNEVIPGVSCGSINLTTQHMMWLLLIIGLLIAPLRKFTLRTKSISPKITP